MLQEPTQKPHLKRIVIALSVVTFLNPLLLALYAQPVAGSESGNKSRGRAHSREPDSSQTLNSQSIEIAAISVAPAAVAVRNFAQLAQQTSRNPVHPARQSKVVHAPLTSPGDIPGSAVQPEAQSSAPAVVPPPTNALTSPAVATNYQGMSDDDRVIPPDTNGAAGLSHTMTVTNSYIRVHAKSTGAAALTLPEDDTFGDTNGFCASVLPSGSTGVFDPRVVYDPFAGRWIFTAASDEENGNSSVCVATSQSSDPSGAWNLFRFDVDSGDALWADFPTLGFNKDWIFVSANMYTVSNDSFSRGQVYAFNKANLNTGSSAGSFVFTDSTIPFGLQPAVTLDNTLGTEFLIRHANSASGTEKKSTITGTPPASPTLTIDTATVTSTLGGWSVPSGEFLPQACTSPACTGTARQIDVGDSRVLNAVVRTVGGNTSLWFAQNITLPAGGSPTHAVAQWWQVDASSGSTTNVIQQGRIEDSTATQTNGGNHFAYPTIAVNKNNDALVGYTRFSSPPGPSAAYSFRAGTDTAGKNKQRK